MKNNLVISNGAVQLMSRTDDGINNTLIPSSEWVGTGTYTYSNDGVTFSFTKIVSLDGNVILKQIDAITFEFVMEKENKDQYELLYDNVLTEASNAIINFADVNFNKQYKSIKIQIEGQCSTTGANLYMRRNNNTTNYVLFGNISHTAERLYEIKYENEPTLRNATTIRPSRISLQVINYSTYLTTMSGITPHAVNVEEIENIKLDLSGGATFNAGTRVAVWGVRNV